jgi:hypothetical protein
MRMHNNGSQRELIGISITSASVLMQLPSEAFEFRETFIEVQGNVESAESIQPALGDMLSMLEPTHPKTTSIETINAEEACA